MIMELFGIRFQIIPYICFMIQRIAKDKLKDLGKKIISLEL
jgi:hypothetical protein